MAYVQERVAQQYGRFLIETLITVSLSSTAEAGRSDKLNCQDGARTSYRHISRISASYTEKVQLFITVGMN